MAITGTMVESDLVKMKDAVVEFDIGGAGSAWAPVESWANSVEPQRGTVPVSSEFTLDAEQHVSIGPLDTSRVRITLFWTEDSTDPAQNLYTVIGTAVDVRWSKSGTAGDIRYYTTAGILIDAPPPGFNSSNNESTKVTYEISCTDITAETIAT